MSGLNKHKWGTQPYFPLQTLMEYTYDVANDIFLILSDSSIVSVFYNHLLWHHLHLKYKLGYLFWQDWQKKIFKTSIALADTLSEIVLFGWDLMRLCLY